jgi:butyryl-CoA dehydrogenase
MEFSLTPEQELFRKSAREFALKELEPIAAEIDRTHRVPLEILKKLGELGYLGMTVPEEYGGIGADMLSYVVVMEELSRSCASTSTAFSVQNSLCNTLLVEVWQRSPEEKVSARSCGGQALWSVRAHRAGVGLRRRGHEDHCRRQGGLLRPQRIEALYHERRIR